MEVDANSESAFRMDHGYDETKRLEDLTIDDLRAAAEFRGGKLLSESYDGNPEKALEWECHDGHRFSMTPKLILWGGHWCPECLPPAWNYDEQAQNNPFFAQAWLPNHTGEHNKYE